MYKAYMPGAALRDVVRNYTIIHFQFDANQAPPPKQRSPKPEQKLVFYINGSVHLQDAHGTTRTPPPVAIYSHQTEKKNLKVSSDFYAFIVYFQPGVLHRLLHLPMTEFPGEYIDAENFFGTDLRFVNERLAAATDPMQMIAIVEQFLLTHHKKLIAPNAVDAVANYILHDPVAFSLDALADQANLSTRQFYRRFIQRIGLTPKFYSRLTRFNRAYHYKLIHPAVTWSAIAQEYGYTDYHHLEKEFKEFIGTTPKAWIVAELSAPERLLRLR